MPTLSADGIYYVDLGNDPTFTGGSFVSVYPEQLAFDDEIRQVGNCSFQISFSAKDQDGATVVNGHDFIGPYRSYFRLRYGNVGIMAGPIVSWKTRLGDDFMSVVGKTWEHYFQRWQYPFNPSSPLDNIFPKTFMGNELTGSGSVTPASLAYQANNRDVIYIIGDIVSNIMNLSPYRQIFDLSNLTSLSGIRTNYQLSLGDSSTFFSLISDLSTLGDGFDWWVSWDKKIFWASPYRFGNYASPSLLMTFDGSTDAATPDNLEFENNGPTATHVFGQGAGLAASTTLGAAFSYVAAEAQYGRLDMNYDFGDIRNQDEIDAKTHKQLSIDLNPQHNIPFSLDPARISNFWSNFRKGRAIYINYEMIAHKIDSAQQLVKYDAKSDENGNLKVDYTLKQIYNVSSGVGVREG